MMYMADIHHRRSTRLQGYDYSQAGAYFVTVCTHNRECLFGEISEDQMLLNETGKIAAATWQALPQRFPSAALDAFVIMPNHIHCILRIAPDHAHQDPMIQGAINRAPTLGKMVRVLKAVSTQQIRQAGLTGFAWQRNYYEHIIRDDLSFERICEYIENNPLQWALDRENPANMKSRGGG